MDDKYIVFKREDWEDFVTNYGCKSEHEKRKFGQDATLYDAVVIRTKDEFAGPALHVYSQTISIVARLNQMLMPELSKRLQKVADYFHERALEADENSDKKLPD